MRALGMVFFGNARPKSNARAHLKQRKKHRGLNLYPASSVVDFNVIDPSLDLRHSQTLKVIVSPHDF